MRVRRALDSLLCKNDRMRRPCLRRHKTKALLVFLAAAAIAGALVATVPAQRGDGGGLNVEGLPAFASQAERGAWERVLETAEEAKPAAVEAFLRDYPHSQAAAQAHYLLAISAFDRGDFAAFAQHGEEAAERLRGEASGHSRVRYLQLLSQLAFFYAESGHPESARPRLDGLISGLEGPPPSDFSPLQWDRLKLRLSATGHYVRGRLALSAAVTTNPPDKTELDQAIAAFRAALRDNPLDDYALYRLAGALLASSEKEEAERAFARTAAIQGAASRPAAKRLIELLAGKPDRSGKAERMIEEETNTLARELAEHPRSIFALPNGIPHPVLWWDAVPRSVRGRRLEAGDVSNIRPRDYAGPESCRPCHLSNYNGWSQHSHRWMNALASNETVRGDFSDARIRYRKGTASFYRADGRFRMKLQRDSTTRVYEIHRTIGSRFFQYYAGRLIEGPEPKDHLVRREDHVLPFGYWLDEKQWVPVVHINREAKDEEREDPFSAPALIHYDRHCSACHTTRPIGDWMLTLDGRLRLAGFAPRPLSFDAGAYLASVHPDLLNSAIRQLSNSTTGKLGKSTTQQLGNKPEIGAILSRTSNARIHEILDRDMNNLPAVDTAVTLGVSCEACHNGAKRHAEESTRDESHLLPFFFPAGETVYVGDSDAHQAWGRTRRNKNWTCARCHSGARPRFAGGMDTWNSTEYSDASRGACYDAEKAEAHGMQPLTCVDCHNPHYTIGKRWTQSPEEDDAKCLKCHPRFAAPGARAAHTHHSAGNPGDRCLNCHMPRINEGLQDMVRTHRISRPTDAAMIEANQPNACNLCHVSENIDWTLSSLKNWYGVAYDPDEILKNYPARKGPVAVGWLASAHESTRLVGADALVRRRSKWALPQLIPILDDPYLINRQFTARRLEEMLGVKLDKFGYRFYQTAEERKGPLRKIRQALLKSAAGSEDQK